MKCIALSLACLGLLAPILTATSITFVGAETGAAVENWSDTAEVKNHDLDGNNRYGEVGYYQIRPAAAGAIFSSGVSSNNDLGITLNFENLPEGLPKEPEYVPVFFTDYLKPAFLSANPLGAEGIFYNFDYFPQFRNPEADTFVQQGSLSVTINNFVTPEPDIEFGWNKAFSFTLGEAAAFRIGVAVDTVDSSERAPDKVSIFNLNTGEVFSSALTRDGVPDMVFFDIAGNVGDEFAVNLWQTDIEIGTSGPVAFALITFDQLPTLTCTHGGGNITLTWEAWIPGWILESSTDLGVGDDWGPAPYPNNNNSVTVPMAGEPKNFFRLKKSP